MKTDELEIYLKSNGHQVTRSRQKLYEMLKKSSPVGLKEVVRLLPGTDRATIYRNIRLFEDLGILHKIRFRSGYKLELAGSFHAHPHHLVCRKCAVTIPLPNDKRLNARLERLSADQGFVAEEHYLEIVGLCANC